MYETSKKEKEAYKRSNIDPRTFVILDDCLYDNRWARDKINAFTFYEWSSLENYADNYYAISSRYTSEFKNKYRLYVLFYENLILQIENVFMKIMLVCFLHLNLFVK